MNFCPGVTFTWTNGTGPNATTMSQAHITPNMLTMPCEGTFGVAIKEWEVITEVKVAGGGLKGQLSEMVFLPFKKFN
jgi:hypothetical protein